MDRLMNRTKVIIKKFCSIGIKDKQVKFHDVLIEKDIVYITFQDAVNRK